MKMKRWISLLLTLTLCLGLLPGAVLAEGTQDETDAETVTIDDVIYTKVYALIGDSYLSSASCEAASDTGLKLYYTAENEYIELNGSYEYSCYGNIGSVNWHSGNSEVVWNTQESVPETSGYILATNESENYAFAVSVTAARVGVYDSSNNYRIESNRTFLITDTVSLVTGNSEETITKVEDDTNGKLTYTGIGTNAVVITATGTSESLSAVLTVSISESSRTRSITLNFVDGATKLYNNGETSISCAAGDDCSLNLVLKTYGEEDVFITDLNSVSCTIGSIVKSNEGSLFWQCFDLLPGASGYIRVTTTDGTYTIPATVELPLYGLYSTDPTNGDYSGYISRTNGKSTVNFTSSETKTVYLYIGNDHFSFVEGSIASDNNAVAVTYKNNKTLTVTLNEGNTGTINVLVTCPASDGYSTQNWEYRIIFSDGTELYNEGGNLLALNNEAGGSNTFHIYYGESLTEVPVDAIVAFSDSKLGTIEAATGEDLDDGNWVWNRNTAVPGTSGKLYVKVGSTTYSCNVSVTLPTIGVYSDANFENYVLHSNRTFEYTTGNAPTVYLRPTNSSTIDSIKKGQDKNNVITVTPSSDNTFAAVTVSADAVGTNGVELVVTTSNNEECYVYVTFVNTSQDSSSGNEGGSTLYATLTNGTLSNPIAGVKFADGPSGFSVNYTTGVEKTVYYISTETASDGSADDKVSVTKHATSENIYVITLASGCSGTVVGEVTVGNGGFPIVFSDKPYALYNSENNEYMADENGDYTITCSVVDDHVEAQTVYFRLNDSTATFGNGSGALLSIPNGPTLISSQVNGTVLSVKFIGGTSNVSTEVTLVVGDTIYTFDITFTDGSSSDGNGGSPNTLASPKRDLISSDIISRMAASQNECGPVSFEYDTNEDGVKETYYLCTMNANSVDETVYSMAYTGASGTEYHEGATVGNSYCMGIWTYDASSNRYSLVSGDTKDILLAAFGSSWAATTYRVSDDDPAVVIADYPSYPAIYSWNDENGWPLGVMFQFDEDSIGSWQHEFSGTIDGQTVTMRANFTCFFVYESLEETVDSVEAANATLQKWSRLKDSDDLGFMGDTSYTLTLESGVFNGIIYVPSNMVVNIHGSDSGERTVLNGGIGGLGCAFNVCNIDFVGCGWWATNWPNDNVYKGEVNYGLFPQKGAEYLDCSFKNFYHAIHCGPTDNHVPIITFGGHRSTFENNFIASYLNSTANGGGNMTMEENVFRHNGCALWMENTGNDFPMNSFALVRCKFYDNGWDVINMLGRCYFVPGQLFERDGAYGYGKFTRDRNALSLTGPSDLYASTAVTDASETGSGVYTFPVAKDRTFENFDYTNSNAVIANFNASSWLIPEENLSGKTITVIQNDMGEDAVVWSFE